MPDSADEEFLELLKKSPFEEPSPFGEITLDLKVAPASIQSKQKAKAALEAAIHQETSKYRYLLTGDVGMEITWHFHEHHRYETDASADIDNLLKPMLDAFCGPHGLLVDDCQIRTLGISWINATSDHPAVTIQIKFIDSDFVPKAGIAFVQMEGAICMPVDRNLPIKVQRILLMMMRSQFAHRRRAQTVLSLEYYSAGHCLPAQRRFHKTRLQHNFTVMDARKYRATLRQLP